MHGSDWERTLRAARIVTRTCSSEGLQLFCCLEMSELADISGPGRKPETPSSSISPTSVHLPFSGPVFVLEFGGLEGRLEFPHSPQAELTVQVLPLQFSEANLRLRGGGGGGLCLVCTLTLSASSRRLCFHCSQMLSLYKC